MPVCNAIRPLFALSFFQQMVSWTTKFAKCHNGRKVRWFCTRCSFLLETRSQSLARNKDEEHQKCSVHDGRDSQDHQRTGGK